MPARLSQGVPDPLANPDVYIIRGTPGSDTLVGTAPAGSVEIFNGNGGNDVFVAGPADALFRGGSGVDTYIGGPGFDRVGFYLEAQAPHGVYASLATQTVYDDGYGNTEHMSSIEGLGIGTLWADTLVGDDNANLLVGGRGDLILGGGGDDVIVVWDAPALIDGGSGVNTVLFAGARQVAPANGGPRFGQEDATHGISIDLSQNLILDDGFGGSGVVKNIQNVFGSPLNDVIVGNSQDNVLMGLGGDDTMTGGGGDDIFLFDNRATDAQGNPLPNGHDVITDFHHGHDKLAINMPGVRGIGDLTIVEGRDVDVLITYGAAGDTIELLGIHHVSAKDFIFGPI